MRWHGGRKSVRNLAANGCNVVGFGEMGIGNTASASLLTHCLTGTPLADCVGRGTGLDDAGLARKQVLLEQALTRYRNAGGNDEPAASAGRIRRLRDRHDGRRHAGGGRSENDCC
jgi:nicotinate-nucleotide--dimethylbenzimidazole phosphoribosyltransferase